MSTKSIFLAFASLSALASTQAASAQTAPVPAPAGTQTDKPSADVPDIIVTARRKNESLQSVPISITALSGQALEQRGITDAFSLQTAVPSLSISTNGPSRVNLAYAIRGQRTNQVLLLTDSPVGSYFAEVNLPRNYGFGNQFYDLQNIQVLKGVQGTLFGRNMTGGAVLVEPAHPEFGKLGAEVKAQVGNYNLRDIFAMVNVPIGDSVALRLDAKHRERDGFTTDVASGEKFDDQNYDSFRASLAIKHGAFASNTVFDYLLEKEHGTALKLNAFDLGLDPRAGGGTTYPTTLALQAGYTNALIGAYHAFGAPTPTTAAGQPIQNLGSIFARDVGLGHYQVDYGAPNAALAGTSNSGSPYLYLQNYGFTNKSTLAVGPVTLKNIIGYRKINFQRLTDLDGSSANLIYSQQSTKTQNFSEEFQAQGKAFGDALDLTVGGYYFSESGTDYSTSSQFPQLTSIGFALAALGGKFGPASQNIGTANFFLNQPASTFVNADDPYALSVSYAFYGAGTYKLTQELKLSAGIRYNNDLRKAIIHDTNPNYINIGFPTCAFSHGGDANTPNVNFDAATCTASSEKRFQAATWDVTLTYEPSRNLTAYVSTRKGYRSGGFAIGAASDAAFAAFKPETVQEYEVGLKNRFELSDAILTTSAALFYQDYKNVQKQLVVLNPGSNNTTTITTNTAVQHDYGAELEANLRFRNGIGANLFASYVNNHIVTDASGIYPMWGIPHTQIGGALTYLSEIHGIGTLNANVNAAYKSSTPLDDYDTSAIQKGYAVANARIDLSNIRGTGFGAAVFVTNITNAYYGVGALSLISNGPRGVSGGVGFGALSYSEPRMYGIELSFKY